jgi:hypothetical protein
MTNEMIPAYNIWKNYKQSTRSRIVFQSFLKYIGHVKKIKPDRTCRYTRKQVRVKVTGHHLIRRLLFLELRTGIAFFGLIHLRHCIQKHMKNDMLGLIFDMKKRYSTHEKSKGLLAYPMHL